MIFYDTIRMMSDLSKRMESIPNKMEQEFLKTLQDSKPFPIISMEQYTKLLELYNKYIIHSAPNQ